MPISVRDAPSAASRLLTKILCLLPVISLVVVVPFHLIPRELYTVKPLLFVFSLCSPSSLIFSILPFSQNAFFAFTPMVHLPFRRSIRPAEMLRYRRHAAQLLVRALPQWKLHATRRLLRDKYALARLPRPVLIYRTLPRNGQRVHWHDLAARLYRPHVPGPLVPETMSRW